VRMVHEHDGAKIIQLRDRPSTHLIGDHISITIYESHEPGRWVLGCAAARYDNYEFTARPHDVDDALRVAVNQVGDRLNWLLRQQKRELTVMRKAIKPVDQPTLPELGSRE
jgi:hypothetical protein